MSDSRILTTVITGPCDKCHGTNSVASDLAGTTYDCTYCDGSGVRKLRGYGGYKTAAGAARALANRTGATCHGCKGTGQCVRPDTTPCYAGCSHEGLVVTVALPGMSWGDTPRSVRTTHARGDMAEAYASAVDIRVMVANRSGTWNESFLGLGSLVSCTDYGTQWDLLAAAVKTEIDTNTRGALTVAREALIAKVRAEYLKDFQWCNVTTSDDTLATVIGVTVHRTGYTVAAVNAAPPNVALPPTYTADVLNRTAW